MHGILQHLAESLLAMNGLLQICSEVHMLPPSLAQLQSASPLGQPEGLHPSPEAHVAKFMQLPAPSHLQLVPVQPVLPTHPFGSVLPDGMNGYWQPFAQVAPADVLQIAGELHAGLSEEQVSPDVQAPSGHVCTMQLPAPLHMHNAPPHPVLSWQASSVPPLATTIWPHELLEQVGS